jgi:hypothetical protein
VAGDICSVRGETERQGGRHVPCNSVRIQQPARLKCFNDNSPNPPTAPHSARSCSKPRKKRHANAFQPSFAPPRPNDMSSRIWEEFPPGRVEKEFVKLMRKRRCRLFERFAPLKAGPNYESPGFVSKLKKLVAKRLLQSSLPRLYGGESQREGAFETKPSEFLLFNKVPTEMVAVPAAAPPPALEPARSPGSAA